MNRHHRRWLALILGIIAGYATLALLLDAGLTPRGAVGLLALGASSLGLALSLSARRPGCTRQTDRR